MQEIMLDMLYFLVFFGIFAFPMAIVFGSLQAVMYLWLLLIPFFINFVIRRQIAATPIMIIAHIVIPAAVFFFAPGGAIRWVIFVMVTILAIFSLTQRANRKREMEIEIKGASIIIMIILYLFCTNQGFYYMTFIYPVLILLVMIGGTLHTRMIRMDYSLESASNFSAQHIKQIRRFDRKAVLALIAILLAFTAFIRYVFVDNILRALASFWNSLFSDITIEGELDIIPVPPAPAQDFDVFGYLADAREPHPMMEIIMGIIGTIITIMTAAVAVALIIFLAIVIYKRMGYKAPPVPPGEDEREFILPTWTMPKRKYRSSIPGDNEIRKKFYKTIRYHIKKGVPIEKSDTPHQMAARIKSEDIHELVENYSRTRYRLWKTKLF